eukprot:3057106-Rhodomonas_salina.1
MDRFDMLTFRVDVACEATWSLSWERRYWCSHSPLTLSETQKINAKVSESQEKCQRFMLINSS